jgi:DNA-directed RNA polymerase specialized sigma24 family protein
MVTEFAYVLGIGVKVIRLCEEGQGIGAPRSSRPIALKSRQQTEQNMADSAADTCQSEKNSVELSRFSSQTLSSGETGVRVNSEPEESDNPPHSLVLLKRLQADPSKSNWEDAERHWSPRIYQWARSRGLNENDANEVVQEIFIIFVQQVQTVYVKDGSLKAWIGTLINVLQRTLRKGMEKSKTLTPQHLEQLASEPAIRALKHELERIDHPGRDRSYLESEIARFQAIVARVRSDTKIAERTWNCFILVEAQGLKPSAVNHQLWLKPGTAGKYRSRLRNLLMLEMELDPQDPSHIQLFCEVVKYAYKSSQS